MIKIEVRHHDHNTGQFISTLCYNCNITLQYKKVLPVYIHNLKVMMRVYL
jgi:hypothetical protein